ncbi:methylmalonyl-CoA mutase, N-terminal domain [Desulfofundulus australicus DSM 11792]|uniref:Methylmalonyl-CoA mutase, N-terminal domain n=2 Tax=Peptococcaceae TaxID=186807 RepID=A0A1M5CYR6_9FIRM|nr:MULTISPECIES: methylmalonyl-CoA mutase family protein [Desulfofundulus]MBE3586377.1 methylmalonyl-CoA mutase family protein [Thermoanaerobacter sp.]MCS5697277.1 methylmalonyl-CoA mutase family protein [Desulfofundulus thermocisternus]SHF59652.1 methylmalonyl-CoA mutase, N-terminal domain [Desulfofundulus australicus DSM 11792]
MNNGETRGIREGLEKWREKREQMKDRDFLFETVSGMEVKDLYTPLDIENLDYQRDLGFPGEYPFTRGVYRNMYRGRLWTMRQFAGFATAKESNKRYKYLLEKGQTGLSVAFDMPTIMGYDSDHPRALGEVGRVGVAIDSLQDMETLFEGIPLDKVSTSMTINAPAAVIWCMYIATGEKQGVRPEQLTGTIQNDILKEYIAQKSWIFPPEPSMRLITDIFAYASRHVPKWNTISISGYHIREAGSTAVQELAFTLANGFAYVEAGIKAGLNVDEFAPRLSFFFNAHIDFFEEIAKYRAARRIWARRMREKYGAKDPRSWLLRFHTQTAGCSLTAQQPENNIVRTAYEALAAVLGGTQSLHTNSMDEVLALPTEKAVQIALRTQQILAYETGVANVIDPLAGSYYVEALTNKMEEEAEKYFEEIEKRGGVLACIEQNFFQQEIADAAYRYQRALDSKQRILVGVNEFVNPDEKLEIEILKIDPRIEQEQVARLQKLRRERDNIRVRETLDALRRACEGTENVIPYILDCVRAYATEGEIIQVMREVFGEYKEKPTF